MSSEFPSTSMNVRTLSYSRGSILRQKGKRFGVDAVMAFSVRAASAVVVVMLFSLIFILAKSALPSIRTFGWSFLTSTTWRPNELQEPARDAKGNTIFEDGEMVMKTTPPEFGAAPVIYGTTVSSVIALCFAVPLSLGAALFLVRVAPKLKVAGPVSFLVEFLAAIPSIAYGIWGLFVLAPFLQGGKPIWSWLAWLAKMPGLRWLFQPSAEGPAYIGFEPMLKVVLGDVPGFSWLFHVNGKPIPLTGRDMFSGGLVLGIMILPIITAVSRDVLKAVPRAQIEGTLALGATWWQSCREMLRYSRAGIFGAVMLGLARAAGETMAVTMVIGNNPQMRATPLAPAQTMSSLLASEFPDATGLHMSALLQVALILLAMSLLFNVVARYMVVGKGARTAAAH